MKKTAPEKKNVDDVKRKSIDDVKLPQTLNSLLSGTCAVVSLWAVLLLIKLTGFLPKDFGLPENAWIIVFAAFAVGDTVYRKTRKTKTKKRKRRYEA